MFKYTRCGRLGIVIGQYTTFLAYMETGIYKKKKKKHKK